MLAAVGVSSFEELFCCIPDELRPKKDFRLPAPLTEPELVRHFEAISERNKVGAYLSFLGAGAYPHFIPHVVDYLSSRGEFISPYTPYQPEVSQGTLQVIFEYQTLICQLTGLEISNASLYDGASAAAEAVLMAHRLKNKPKVLVARTVHPQSKGVIQSYVRKLAISQVDIDYDESGRVDLEDLSRKLDQDTCAVVCQSPNFFGVVEDLDSIAEMAHRKNALLVVTVAEAVSLGLLKPPGDAGADIVSGEGQSFGLPLSFGGPYLGFMACRQEYLRQFPGRIAGATKDTEGKRGFTLTLSTREQHIRREKATSNICTNQAWCALRAAIFLETMGRSGMRELAYQNIQKANYALAALTASKQVRRKFSGPIFNEFVLELPGGWKKFDEYLQGRGVLGGFNLEPDYPELKNCALVCVTEVHRKAEIDRLADLVTEAGR